MWVKGFRISVYALNLKLFRIKKLSSVTGMQNEHKKNSHTHSTHIQRTAATVQRSGLGIVHMLWTRVSLGQDITLQFEIVPCTLYYWHGLSIMTEMRTLYGNNAYCTQKYITYHRDDWSSSQKATRSFARSFCIVSSLSIFRYFSSSLVTGLQITPSKGSNSGVGFLKICNNRM